MRPRAARLPVKLVAGLRDRVWRQQRRRPALILKVAGALRFDLVVDDDVRDRHWLAAVLQGGLGDSMRRSDAGAVGGPEIR